MWEINLDTKQNIKLNNPVLVEGLPGIGNVGKIAVDFLIEELKAKKLLSFFSYKLPRSVFVGEENLIEMPKIEVYYKRFNGGERKDLLLLTGDVQPIDEESCYSFCDEIIKLAKKYNCSEIVTTGGIGLQNIPEKPKVFCTSNDKELLKEYTKLSEVEKEIFGIVGPIVGVSGVLLGLSKKRDLKAAALLAETFGHPMYLGIKGAKELLKVVDKKFNLGLDIKKMSKEIVQVEKELMKKTKEFVSEISKDMPAGAKAKNKEVHYIG